MKLWSKKKWTFIKNILKTKNCSITIPTIFLEMFFEDAFSMQATRIVKNIMKSLNCSEKRAHEIAFCDVKGKNRK